MYIKGIVLQYSSRQLIVNSQKMLLGLGPMLGIF